MGVGERELTYAHLNAVGDLAAGREGSKSVDLPAGLRVVRRYDRLVFSRPGHEEAPSVDTTTVATDGETVLPSLGVRITSEVVQAKTVDIDGYIKARADRGPEAEEEWLDADQVHLPLVVRSRRKGDRFMPLGMNGVKKLSDFFIDEKIDTSRRQKTAVVCDQLGPIWIVPLRIDHRVRLTRLTRRVLKLKASPIQQG
jgi:tRNA(Ile)-lysidine synthase